MPDYTNIRVQIKTGDLLLRCSHEGGALTGTYRRVGPVWWQAVTGRLDRAKFVTDY